MTEETNAGKLVNDIKAMPIVEIRNRIEWARGQTNEELIANWRAYDAIYQEWRKEHE